jgi:proton-translocating NADH-quinone oxidoreductase chain M
MFLLMFFILGLYFWGMLFPLFFFPVLGCLISFERLYHTKKLATTLARTQLLSSNVDSGTSTSSSSGSLLISTRVGLNYTYSKSLFVALEYAYSYLNQLFSSLIFLLLFIWSLFILWSFQPLISQNPTAVVQSIYTYYPFQFNMCSVYIEDHFLRGSNIYLFGIDGISLFFILLTTFLFPICFLLNFSATLNPWYNILLFILELLIILVFLTTDFLFFYICFELILIPMVILILIWGARQRKIKAAYYFFIYTFLGSLCLLLAIMFMSFHYNHTNISFIMQQETVNGFTELCYSNFEQQKILLFLLFVGFAVKIPIFPFHLWLPEAHVEAPTVGSVILAGLLLKLGGYGFLRFVLPLVPQAIVHYLPFLNMFFLLSIIFSSFAILRQIDMKKIIAYSSIGHMNFMLLGMFSLTYEGIVSSLILMLSHGITSSALFILIGVLYDRYHSRLFHYFGGLVLTMPYFVFFFVFFNLSNFGFPGTSNFVGEFLVFLGLAQVNLNVFFFSLVGFILSGVYSTLLINRVCFGTLKTNYINIFQDLLYREHFILSLLFFISLFIGFFPSFFIVYMDDSVVLLLQRFYAIEHGGHGHYMPYFTYANTPLIYGPYEFTNYRTTVKPFEYYDYNDLD